MLSKISLGINALLVVAVIYLFVKTSPSSSVSTDDESNTSYELPENSAFKDGAEKKAPILAYINGDSLNANYNFIKDRSKSLEQKYRAADERVRKEYQKRQQEVQELVAYAQSKKLPDDEARVVEETLGRLQMEMEEIQQRESDNVMQKEMEMQKELVERVQKFLESYTKQKGIDYVVNYQSSTQFILYGNTAYDITADVLNGLNAEYATEKASEKK